jgi:hypothetical protein
MTAPGHHRTLEEAMADATRAGRRRAEEDERRRTPYRCPTDGSWLLPGMLCTTCAALSLYRRAS